MLILLALNYSLRLVNRKSVVDIHFIDVSRGLLKDVMLLKVNEDNIRLRNEDKIIILNKSQVLKIEMKIPKEDL